MASPSPEAIALIRAQITDWGRTDAEIAAALNAPSVANPTPQGQVPKPFGYPDLRAVLSDASLANLRALPSFPRILDDVNAMSRGPVAAWADLLLRPPAVITQAEHDALLAIVAATAPDPSYQATIGWAQATLGRPVDEADIQEARP